MAIKTPVRVLASSNASRVAAAIAHGDVGIALHHSGRPEMAGLGAGLRQAVSRLPKPPSAQAWDFLSIALAVYGADRFIPRRDFADAWTRMIALEVELHDPEPWIAVTGQLAAALRFLSSDIWYLTFRSAGDPRPAFPQQTTDRDCACLFSGGLDSLIGALNLRSEGRRPLLVSQASPKEGPVQTELAGKIGLATHRFDARVSERWRQPYEPSSRVRSILFMGYGVVVASSLPLQDGRTDLIIPENGLISINPPLTRRHIGSLSTRTTHPHLIATLQQIFDSVGMNVRLFNPYGHKTKGEMLSECQDPVIVDLASVTYSCGKGKRHNQHCGRCVPCLIRRASFHHAGLSDGTCYRIDDLAGQGLNEDVAAMRYAAANLSHQDVSRWAAQAGPLSDDPSRRTGYVNVVRRGIQEVQRYFETIPWP